MNTRKPLTNAGNRHSKQIAAMLAMGVPLEHKDRRRRDSPWVAIYPEEFDVPWIIDILLDRNPTRYLSPYLWRRKLY